MSDFIIHQEKIKKYFNDFKLIFKNEISSSEWDKLIENNCSFFPYEYSSGSIDYQNEYQRNSLTDVFDLSFIVLNGSVINCFYYFSLIKKNNQSSIISLNGPHANSIVSPLNSNSMNKKTEKKIISSFFSYILYLKEKKLNKIIFRESLCEKQSISMLLNQLLLNSYKLNTLFINYLNIKNINFYKNSIRKSYKSLINSTLKKINYLIIDKDCKELYLIKDLHLEISGRKTRSEKSWKLQFNQILKKKGFIINLYFNNQICGSSMFLKSRDEVIYASGVYKDIDGLHLGHAAQHIAINHMNSLKMKWYRIGEMPFSNFKLEHHSEKMKSIANFKNGFSSNLIPVFFLE